MDLNHNEEREDFTEYYNDLAFEDLVTEIASLKNRVLALNDILYKRESDSDDEYEEKRSQIENDLMDLQHTVASICDERNLV